MKEENSIGFCKQNFSVFSRNMPEQFKSKSKEIKKIFVL